MTDITLGIIGGGQLGSMLAISAKKLNIKTVIYCDDLDAPAQNFCSGRAPCAGRIAGTGVGQGVRRCMSPMHPRMVLVSFTCVPA